MIDPQTDFSVVYSLHQHDQFGFLIGAFVVERNPHGNLTLKFQRLLPENLDNFRANAALDETDRELCRLCHEITIQALYKTFGGSEASLQEFSAKFLQKTNQEHANYVLNYIERRKQQILPLLKDRLFYRMSKDGYPAWKEMRFIDEKAEIQFHYDRLERETHYMAEVNLRGKVEELFSGYTGLIAMQPAWVVRNAEVFTFDENVDGKKLNPFTKKKTIVIPRSAEEEHFRKFMLPLLEQYPVTANGFDIRDVAETPVFKLILTKDSQQFVHFKLSAYYGQFEIAPAQPAPYKAQMEKTDDNFIFYRIKRDLESEKNVLDVYQSLRDEKNRLFDLSLKEPDAFDWLQQSYARLITAGIEVVQQFEKDRFNLNQPTIDYKIVQDDAGFLVKAELLVGDERFPFADLKKQLLRGITKFSLPDASYVFLPQSWTQDFQHFFETARETPEGFRLQAYQAALLQNLFQTGESFSYKALEAFESIEKQEPPAGLQAELRDYQAAGYDWLCFLNQYNLNGILADDMGLGKTIQTLAVLLREKERNVGLPSLVVVPNSLVFNWVEEAKRFAPEMKTEVYTGAKRDRKRDALYKYDLVVTTYGTVRQDEEFFAKMKFNYAVLDESHLIKNNDAKTTKAVFQLNANHRLSLTGTPIENSTTDLWAQMHFLNPGLLGGANFFEKYFANPIEKERNDSRAEKLHKLVKPFILRRTKEMVAGELPDRVEQIHYCEMSAAQRKLYNDTRSLYKTTLFKDAPEDGVFERNQLQILSCLQRLRQIAIHPQMIDPTLNDSGKYQELLQMLNDVLAQGSKAIVFSNYVKFLNILKYDLIKRQIPYSYIDGSVKDRQREVEKFQQNDDTQVFLISMKAGGVGLNLTKAEYVFLIDPWWNPAIEQQAIARAHRIGQTKTVFAYKFITRGSIEERILALQQRKSQLAGDIIKNETLFFKSLSREDLISLFE